MTDNENEVADQTKFHSKSEERRISLQKGEPAPIFRNRCKCAKCGDIIESKYRHDFVSCKCGAIWTDGGTDYIRRGAMDFNDIIDMPYESEDK
jgi:hypothetical protein